jgi:hypothetical protein
VRNPTVATIVPTGDGGRAGMTGDRLAEEQAGSFGARVRALQPDVVIDLICFHGPSVEVPTTEDQPRRPCGDYGITKAAIAAA